MFACTKKSHPPKKLGGCQHLQSMQSWVLTFLRGVFIVLLLRQLKAESLSLGGVWPVGLRWAGHGKFWGGTVPMSTAESFALAPCLFVSNYMLFCLCCVFMWITDANTPKKCRALFGLDQLGLWCKPCRYIRSPALGGA